MARQSAFRLSLLVLVSLGLAGSPVWSRERTDAIQAYTEIPEEALLDVGIELFDPGLPEDDEHAKEEDGIYPELRKSEARYIPFHLKNTLEATGHWGAVRVVPRGTEGIDLMISGEILKSTGHKLSVRVRMTDARGKVWREDRYTEEAEPSAYGEDSIEVRDPYQSLYNRIANDMLESREKLDAEELQTLREISRLRFAADLAPTAFTDYLDVRKNGRYTLNRLPSGDDPMLDRIARVRQRDEMFVDTLNEYYAEFYARMGAPYDNWREFSFEEQMALREIRRKARKRMILAGLLILGGAATSSSTTLGDAVGDAAVIGGALAMQSGIEKQKEAKIHKEALKELAASFDAEIEPLLVEVDGQTLRLEGSAEAQFAEWRRLLAEMFATQTGLPAETPAEEP
jgi:hypothetical protein